jgi:hypothetical protein
MIRYINYVLTAILIMLVLPLMPVLAIAVIPVAFIYYLVEPREKFIQNFSLRRYVRGIEFKLPKKALAFYIFWLYVHLVFLGAFSTGIFNSANMGFSNFWPFNGDIGVYDITEFMVYTGPPLFFIILFGLTHHEVAEDNEMAYAGGRPDTTINPVYVPPTHVMDEMDRPTFAEPVQEEPVMVATSTVMEDTIPSTATAQNQELLEMIRRQQERIELLDAELQNLKFRMPDLNRINRTL